MKEKKKTEKYSNSSNRKSQKHVSPPKTNSLPQWREDLNAALN